MEKKNWLFLIIVAIFVSLIFGGIHILLFFKLKDSYSPILINQALPSFARDETVAYAPKVREVFDGHLILTDLYLAEHKTLPSLLIGENLPAILMAFLAKISGSIPQAFIFADFLFPSVILIILTLLVFSLSENFSFSIFTSLVVIFFYGILEYLPFIPSILKMLITHPLNGFYSGFIRSFHPQVSFLFFVLFIFFTFLAFKKNKMIFWLTAGLFLGSLFYSYIFFATYGYALMGTLLLYWLISKKLSLVKRVLTSLSLGLLVDLPYIVNLFAFQKLPQAKEFISNFKYPNTIPWKIIIFCLFFILLSRFLKPKRLKIFFTLFFLAGLILLTLSYVFKLNINDSPGHWAMAVIYPFSIINLSLFIQQGFLSQKKAAFWISLCLIALAYQTSCHFRYFSKQENNFILAKEEKEMLSWLNKTQKDSVVLTASLKYNLLIPALTHNNVFLPYSQYSLSSEKEAFERFFILYKFLEISPERIREMFSRTPSNEALARIKHLSYDDCAGSYFYYLRFKKKHNYFCDIPSEKLEEIINSYQEFNLDPQSSLKKYEIDYLLFGPYEQKWARISLKEYPCLKLIEENKDYQLYQIQKYE